LIAAVSLVYFVPNNMMDADFVCQFNRIIFARIIHQYHFIDNIQRNFLVGFLKGFFCVIGGHNDNQFFRINHCNNLSKRKKLPSTIISKPAKPEKLIFSGFAA